MVITLPDNIISNSSKEEIIFHNYIALKGSFRGKSVLSKNAISLVVKGEKTMRFSSRVVNANDSEIHFLSAGNCIASVDLCKQAEFRSILVFFDDKVLDDFLVKNAQVIEQSGRKQNALPQPYISLKKDKFIHHYISSLQLLLSDPGREMSARMKLLKFEELLQYLLETYPAVLFSFQVGAKLNRPSLLQIRSVVELNIASNLSIEELAFLCNVSVSTFKRRFQEIYHDSPYNWLLVQKMKMAENLLRNRLERPGDIFHKVGFESHSAFTKSFKKIYGVTPSAFMERMLNE